MIAALPYKTIPSDAARTIAERTPAAKAKRRVPKKASAQQVVRAAIAAGRRTAVSVSPRSNMLLAVAQ
jgi:hypothetical protein